MKHLSILFNPDGTVFGSHVNEALCVKNAHRPPSVQRPGDTAPRAMLVQPLGLVETDGTEKCPCCDAHEQIETHPDSTPKAPKFAIKAGCALPVYTPFPLFKEDLGNHVRRHGPHGIPTKIKAWITLMHPELAREHRLHKGIADEALLAVEKLRTRSASHFHEAIEERIAKRKANRRAFLFTRNAKKNESGKK